MATITIRNLNDNVKTRVHVRASDDNRSIEKEATLALRDAVGRKPRSRCLTSISHSHLGAQASRLLRESSFPDQTPSRSQGQ